jgi:RHS repeat-associated protein
LSYNGLLQLGWFQDVVGTTTLLNATLDWGTSIKSDNGNLRGSTYTHQGGPGLSSPLTLTQSYTYDWVNRLSRLVDNGAARRLTYDAYGNWYVAYNSGSLPIAGNTPTSNVYNSNNQFTNASYDAAGNETGVNGNTVTYDAESRQTNVVGAGVNEMYVYDGDGRRVEKLGYGGTPTTVFVYDALGRMAAEYSTATDSPSCVTCYLSVDQLGTARLITDQSGNVVGRHDYLPFGEELAANQDGRTGQWGVGNDSINQKFTGKERDAESGLGYFGARYYGSALGRFSSPDQPLIDQQPIDPQSWNLYSYVRNNPLAHVDPDGLDCVTTSNQTSGGVTVTTERGGSADTCSGTYVNGTVDVSSYQYNGSSLSWSDNSSWGGGAINFVSPSTPNDALSPDVANMLNSAGNMAAPGVNLAARGLMAFGWVVAPEAMVLAECGSGYQDCSASAPGPRIGVLFPEGGVEGKAAKEWQITNPAARKIVGGRTYLKDANTGTWWSRDTAGHGGSAWKVYQEVSPGKLQWIADADAQGNYISGKWKSPAGTSITF